MSCNDCDKFENEGKIAYYRWNKSNIGMIGCQKHLREIFDTLNKAQKKASEKSKLFKERLNKNAEDFDLIIVDVLEHIDKLEEKK